MPGPTVTDEKFAVVLYERALRAELAKTLKDEAPVIKQKYMRKMAATTPALNIQGWDERYDNLKDDQVKLIEAHELKYLTSRFDRLKYKLFPNTNEAIAYNSALKQISNATQVSEYNNPYVLLREADVGFLEGIWKFYLSLLQNDNNLPTSFKWSRNDYFEHQRALRADAWAALTQPFLSAWSSVQARFDKNSTGQHLYFRLDDQGTELQELGTNGNFIKQAPSRQQTKIETYRQRVKASLKGQEAAADAELAGKLDALIVGKEMNAQQRMVFFTKAFKNVQKAVSDEYNNQSNYKYATPVIPNSAKEYAEKAEPKSHIEAQNALREYFSLMVADILKVNEKEKTFFVKDKKGSSPADKLVEEYNKKYAEAVMRYHNILLKNAHENKTQLHQKIAEKYSGDQSGLKMDINHQLEALQAETDVIMAKKRQEYHKAGFTLAKRFAIGCGFFSAGAWAMLIAGFAPWWVAGLSLVPCFYFAFHAMRMNWLSSNDEMSGPFFDAEVDRGDLRTTKQKMKDTLRILLGLEGFAAWKALLFTPQSEYSVKGLKRGAQHAANTTTGVVWGLLTAIGVLSLGYALPAIFYPGIFQWGSAVMMDVALFGTVNIAAFSMLGALGLALGYITYKVFGLLIRDKSDKDLTQGKALYNNYYKELFLISAINNKTRPTSTHYVKQTATLFGILLTAMASVTLLSDIVALTTGAGLGLGFMGLDAAIAVSTLLAFSIIVVAFIGLKDFYIQRSQNSVLKGQADTFGGNLKNFDGDKLANIGIDASAPDFASLVEKANPKRSWTSTIGEIFFSTADGVNSDRSRLVNAMSQAGPAIGGGVAFMLMTVSAGLRALGVISPIAAGIGIGIGILGGICAAVGSFQANGIGNRKVKHNMTEDVLLNEEAKVLNVGSLKSKVDGPSASEMAKSRQAMKVAEALKQIRDYADSTAKDPAEYHGILAENTIRTADKVRAANELVQIYQKTGKVSSEVGPAVNEPGSRLNFLYQQLNKDDIEAKAPGAVANLYPVLN